MVGREKLKEYIPAIDAELVELLQSFRRELPSVLSEQSQWALETIQAYGLRPGKHFRGSLAAATYDHYTNQQMSREGLQLGVAIELMHNYLLIVDDVMDKSSLRRGGPTVHEMYKTRQSDISEFDANMMAINIGVLAQHIASFVIAKLPAERVGQLQQTMHINIAITCFGQVDDLYQTIKSLPSLDMVLLKHQQKSSYYTFINPLECGLSLAGKLTDGAKKDCEAFGLPAGVAFQLYDDHLGIFGDSNASGKHNLDDIREGKYTPVVQYALEHGTDDDKAVLRECIGKANADESDLVRVKETLAGSGAVEYISSMMKNLADEAIDAASSATSWDSDFAKFLADIVRYSIDREN